MSARARARVCVCVCLIVCDLETSTLRQPRARVGLLRHRNSSIQYKKVSVFTITKCASKKEPVFYVSLQIIKILTLTAAEDLYEF